jgi:PAP2 superfamily
MNTNASGRTDPVTPAPAESPPPAPRPPAQGVVTAVSPPSPKKMSARWSLEFALTVEEARGVVKRKPGANDGVQFPDRSQETEPMVRWAPHVRVAMVVGEILSDLEYTSTSTRPVKEATLKSRSNTGAINETIKAPEPDAITSGDEKMKGIGGLIKKMRDRPGRQHRAHAIDIDMDSVFLAVLGLDEGRLPHTRDLVRATIDAVAVVSYWFKDSFAIDRPYELRKVSDMLYPMIEHPGHASFPSGHSAQAYAVATVLASVASSRIVQNSDLYGVAEMAAESREHAGLHYPIDTEAGKQLGRALGQYLVKAETGTKHPFLKRLWALAQKDLASLDT